MDTSANVNSVERNCSLGYCHSSVDASVLPLQGWGEREIKSARKDEKEKGSHVAVFVSSRNAGDETKILVWDHTWLRHLKQILRIAAGQNQVVRSIQVDTQATGLVDKPEGSRILFLLRKSFTWSISEGEERALIAIHALSTTTVRYRTISAQRHHHTLPLTERLQWELGPIPRFARIRASLWTPAVFRCWATYYDGNDICEKNEDAFV